MLIKGYNLDDELIMEIGKFAVLWNLFEKNYCNNNCSSKTIVDACNNITVSKDSQAALAKALNKIRSWFELLYYDYIMKGLYSSNRRPKAYEIKYINAFLKQEGNTICGCLLCVYRIRNNMMHGLKNVDELNNQLEIFKTANKVLEEL